MGGWEEMYVGGRKSVWVGGRVCGWEEGSVCGRQEGSEFELLCVCSGNLRVYRCWNTDFVHVGGNISLHISAGTQYS